MGYLRLSVTDSEEAKRQNGRSTPRLFASRLFGSLSASEIERLIGAFARNGVAKVRFTGEPLLRDDLLEIVAAAARTPGVHTVALTTNGLRLADLAEELMWAGLQRVNLDLDTLDRDKFWDLTGQDALLETLTGLEAALASGFAAVKVNVVVRRGVNDGELPTFCDLGRETRAEVRFVELTSHDLSPEAWRVQYISAAEMRARLGALEPLPRRGHASARRYLLPGGGIAGFISPVSEPFCDGCNRLHVNAAGKLRPCVHAPFAADLRPLLSHPDLDTRLGAILAHMGHLKRPQTRPAIIPTRCRPLRTPRLVERQLRVLR